MKRITLIIVTLLMLFTACKIDEPELIEHDEIIGLEKSGNKIHKIISEPVTIGEGTEWELPGILTLPEGTEEQIPAVVIVHGSGPNDMDGTARAYKPYIDIAEYLTARGIAVLRYDKRTLRHAEKMIESFSDLTVYDETIEDAIIAAEMLKNDSRIDGERVFVLGHSMGGMLAPAIDADGGNFAGIIIFAGSPRYLIEIMYDQVIAQLETLSEEDKVIAEESITEHLKLYEDIAVMDDEDAKAVIFMDASGYYYKNFDASMDRANEHLKSTSKPVLIMHGDKDFQVLTDKDFGAYKELLAGKENVQFKLYEELNHFFIKSMSSAIDANFNLDEYDIPDNVNEGVLQDIVDWILA